MAVVFRDPDTGRFVSWSTAREDPERYAPQVVTYEHERRELEAAQQSATAGDVGPLGDYLDEGAEYEEYDDYDTYDTGDGEGS